MPGFYFLHPSTGRSWFTHDPHHWLLDHRGDDLLAPARERLLLNPDDREQCLRVVLRRCDFVLLHITSDVQIMVRYWSDPPPDMKPWAKEYGWNRPGVGVVSEHVKSGRLTVYGDGQDALMYGERVGDRFPWGLYAAKAERRGVVDADDADPAPASYTNFGWPSGPAERLTWRVLKTIWNAERTECPNCDVPLIVTNFSWTQGPLSFRTATLVRHCVRGCRRRFDSQEPEPLAWLASVLPVPLRPTCVRHWRELEIDWDRLDSCRPRPVQSGGAVA